MKLGYGVLICLLGIGVQAKMGFAETAHNTFVNPVYGGQDPYLCQHDGHYYMAATAPGEHELIVFKSKTLTDRGAMRVVYRAPEGGAYSSELWAPEIHRIDGAWYIYTCGDDGDNANHRLVVLEAETDDPQGSYKQAAVLNTPGWAIDETVFRAADGNLYCAWSGWPDGTVPDSTQHLFISKMKSPVELIGPAIDISGKMYPWETVGRPAGLNEGPQFITHQGRVFILYAASGSWTPDYCLGLMECRGDLLDADAWVKIAKPVLSRTASVYGPGHGCVTKSPDGSEDWLVYHSSFDPEGSWNRSISIKKYTWNDENLPDFGEPISWGEQQRVPAGTPTLEAGIALNDSFKDLDRWESLCFFRRRVLGVRKEKLFIRGSIDPRYGDKVVLRRYEYHDLEFAFDVRLVSEEGSAGAIFRAHDCGIGPNRYKGYSTRLTSAGELALYKSNGESETELASTTLSEFDLRKTYRLRVVSKDADLSVYVEGAQEPILQANDPTYGSGRIGLATSNATATFDRFEVVPF